MDVAYILNKRYIKNPTLEEVILEQRAYFIRAGGGRSYLPRFFNKLQKSDCFLIPNTFCATCTPETLTP